MSVLHPALLAAGLAAVALPILIHLLMRQRRRPIQWAAMRFLAEAVRRQRKKLRLQHLLLLAARCLLVALLALAIARPVLDAAGILGGAGGRDVYLLLDTGLAASLAEPDTDAADTPRDALDRHRRTAARLIDALGPGDRVGLLTLDTPANPAVIPASADTRAVARLLETLDHADGPTDIPGALEALAARLPEPEADDRPVDVVLLSDFRAGSADLASRLPPALAGRDRLRLLHATPAQLPAPNTQVIDVRPRRGVVLTGVGRPSERLNVTVSLRRTGDDAANAATSSVRVRSVAPGGTDTLDPTPARATVRWRPGQTEANVTVPVELLRSPRTGTRRAAAPAVLLAEIDRDPLDADNRAARPVPVLDALDVAVVDRRRFSRPQGEPLAPADWLRLALAPDPQAPVTVTELEPAALDAPRLDALDAVVLTAPHRLPADAWPRLARFVRRGGLLVVTPPADVSVHLWTDAFVDALGLDWDIAREARRAPEDEPFTLAADQPEPGPAGVLAFIDAELDELAAPVSVFRHLPATPRSASAATAALRLADGTPWLLVAAAGGNPQSVPAATPPTQGDRGTPARGPSVDTPRSLGTVIYLASAPDPGWSDLPARPLMVPLIQEIVRQGVGIAAGPATSLAGTPARPPAGAATLRRLDLRDSPAGSPSGATLIRVDDLSTNALPIRSAGLYAAEDDAGRRLAVLAVNPDPEAGRSGAQTDDAVRAWLAGALGTDDPDDDRLAAIDADRPADVMAEADAGSPASVPLLLAALAVAIAELVMARSFSYAFRDDPREAASA